jgi:hypothetical protein
LKAGFKRKYSVQDAIQELKKNYFNKKLKENINFYSIKKLKKLKIS